MIGTATTDFDRLRQICISPPRALLSCNGSLPVHMAAVEGELFSSIHLVSETHQVLAYTVKDGQS